MQQKELIPWIPRGGCEAGSAARSVFGLVLPGILLAWLGGGVVTADQGLLGHYYSDFRVVSNRIVFDGLTLEAMRIDTSFDFWDGTAQYDWNPIGHRS